MFLFVCYQSKCELEKRIEMTSYVFVSQHSKPVFNTHIFPSLHLLPYKNYEIGLISLTYIDSLSNNYSQEANESNVMTPFGTVGSGQGGGGNIPAPTGTEGTQGNEGTLNRTLPAVGALKLDKVVDKSYLHQTEYHMAGGSGGGGINKTSDSTSQDKTKDQQSQQKNTKDEHLVDGEILYDEHGQPYQNVYEETVDNNQSNPAKRAKRQIVPSNTLTPQLFPVVNTINIKCDLISPYLYKNGTPTHILHSFVAFTRNTAVLKKEEPKHPIYLPLICNNEKSGREKIISEINIRIEDNDKQLINFNNNLFTLVLHLRELEN